MSTKLRINVTKEIIAKSAYCGIKDRNGNLISKHMNPGLFTDGSNTGSNCAIGLAIWDVFPKTWVGNDAIIFYRSINEENVLEDAYATAPISSRVESFITEFDNKDYEERLQMEPISFEIDIPDEVIDRISLEELKESLINHPTLELV